MTESSPLTDAVKLPEDVRAALNNSGFPFQTAVAHVVNATGGGWKVHAAEYVWQTRDGEAHFLDVVATDGSTYLAIECKKTTKRSFTFLRPLGAGTSTGLTTRFRCLRVGNINDSGRRVEVMCEDWDVFPRSHISEFCVATNTDARDRLLERDAGELVQASDAFALSLKAPKREVGAAVLIIPVIVTNAPIYTARYDPRSVSLEKGEFATPPEEITQPPCVRFHKTFPSDSSLDLGARSVFVVTATELAEFLSIVQPVPIGQPAEDSRNSVFLLRPERRRFL